MPGLSLARGQSTCPGASVALPAHRPFASEPAGSLALFSLRCLALCPLVAKQERTQLYDNPECCISSTVTKAIFLFLHFHREGLDKALWSSFLQHSGGVIMRNLIFALAIVAALAFHSETSSAQDSFSCSQCICVADNTCDATGGCSSGSDTGCKGKSFTASCTGQYTLRYAFDCSGGTCAQCYACVFVKDGVGNVIGVAHSTCSSGDCTQDMAGPSLTAGQSYKLYVCKRACDGGNCNQCTNCIARGYAFIGGDFDSACDLTPACNP